MTRLHGLPPIAGDQARVLILGSFPSVASLREKQYYAHPRNQFWRIVGGLFGIDVSAAYSRRCRGLVARRIAVWDVIGRCQRRGSLDSAIRTPEVNDFAAFYREHPHIVAVFFNGAAAEGVYQRLALCVDCPTQFVRLPSTSPANAGMTLQQKIVRWEAVREVVE